MTSATWDPVVTRLLTALENEASALAGVSDEIDDMKSVVLKIMKSFLVDAQRGGGGSNERQKAWVESVRNLTYEVEDTIDEFIYHYNRQRQRSCLRRSLHLLPDLYVRHRVAAKLHGIHKRMELITKTTNQLGTQQLEAVERSPPPKYDPDWKKRMSEFSLVLKDEDLVGIKRPQRELLRRLMDEEEEPRPMIISVVGEGGSGKTVLVANTFKKQQVKQHFEFTCLITASQQSTTEELLRLVAKATYEDTNYAHDQYSCKQVVPTEEVGKMGFRELVETLRRNLQPRRYLIVFDDVSNIQRWRDIITVLPEGSPGSRIMITTRDQRVAAASRSGFVSHVHQIQPLRPSESWQLFCKKAFPNNPEGCPSHLDSSLAKDLVGKCKGWPLAIVALGGLMSYKKSTTAEWKRVYDNLHWEISNNPEFEAVKVISMLSYHELPSHLKPCFLYCCIFPEDYPISRKKLIRLWMAEGFLERVDGVTPEIVAESYLMELISRSLLQVEGRDPSGKVKMHDVLREIALSLSKEEKFVAVSDGEKGVEKSGIRRYSIQVKKDKEIKLGDGGMISQLRSLFIFFVDETLDSSFNYKFPFKFPSGLKLLRVLNLEGAPISELPAGELGKLFNLRYLNISRTQVKELPKSIGKLLNLQTLLLKGAQIPQLPPEIGKLQNLRHLVGFYHGSEDIGKGSHIRVPPNICTIKSLQVLSFVEATDALIEKLQEMTQLTRLDLSYVTEAEQKDLCVAIGKMEHLRHLDLFAPTEEAKKDPSTPPSFRLIEMDALSSAPPSLETLSLAMRMEMVPHWFNGLESLRHLNLRGSELGDDLLSHIQALPNLSSLGLGASAYKGEQLCFHQGFHKLTHLNIYDCDLLTEIVIEKDVMPDLGRLEVSNCKELRSIFAGGLDHLTQLQFIMLEDVPRQLMEHVCGVLDMEKDVDYCPLARGIELTRAEAEADDGEQVDGFIWFHTQFH